MKFFLFFTVLIFPVLGKSQLDKKSFEQIEKGKPTAILFTTEWCGLCRIQKKILDKFHLEMNVNIDFISIDPEKYTKDIYFFDKKYHYISNGYSGLHHIIYDLAGGRVPAYPFWVFVDKNQKVKTYEGLLKEDELGSIFSLHNF